MRNAIKIVTLLALLDSRGVIAQTARSSARSLTTASAPLSLTQGAQLMAGAPVGHRQPHARDVPLQSPGDLDRLTEEDAAVDRKLTICRGC
jgi:hypothetical protein